MTRRATGILLGLLQLVQQLVLRYLRLQPIHRLRQLWGTGHATTTNRSAAVDCGDGGSLGLSFDRTKRLDRGRLLPMLLDVQMDLLLNMLLNMLLRLLELGLELWVRPVVREKLGACGAILQCPMGFGRRGGRRDGARLRNGAPRGGCGGGLREGIRVLGQSPRQLSAQVALALQQGPQAVGKLELALRGQCEGRLLFAQAPVLLAAAAGCLARVGVQPGWVRGPRQVAILVFTGEVVTLVVELGDVPAAVSVSKGVLFEDLSNAVGVAIQLSRFI
uniref:Secreted protein n=1 Tax=Ixodes ricinus TaxID=34613 RepID=A0A6B0V5N1_IXORI